MPFGLVTISGITSTVDGDGDQGADPNKLVALTDVLKNTNPSIAAYEPFVTFAPPGTSKSCAASRPPRKQPLWNRALTLTSSARFFLIQRGRPNRRPAPCAALWDRLRFRGPHR